MSMLEKITEQFPIRRSEKQKEAFRLWAMAQMKEMGYSPKVEENGSHRNVVAGNPETARMTITAHYDTPTCIGIPNLLIPRNFPVYFLYQLLVILGMLAIALLGGLGLALLTNNPDMMRLGLLGVYILLMLFMLYGPANQHNVNDNTSGVAALMETMARIPAEQRQKVAFILFDNEEKGCRGSKAYAKDHVQVQHVKLVVNLDCVGVGEHFLLSVPSLAKNMPEYALLEKTLAAREGRTVHFFGRATTRGNSDYRSFKCGVGVSAHRMVTGIGFYTGAIHTGRDTQADQENLTFLSEALEACVGQLPEEAD